MRILLLGATGRTGRMALEIALFKGYNVTCLVRDAEKIEERDGIKVLVGQVNSSIDIEKAMSGCDCILNILNVSRVSDFPWSKLRSPELLISESIKKVIDIAIKFEVQRLITCSAWGTRESKKDIPIWFRWLIDHSNVGVTYRDHERQEKLVMNSELDWTIIRPVGLTDAKHLQIVKETFGNIPKPSLTINRRTVAEYMVNSITNDGLIGKVVTISQA